ncbi:MAG TPA: hypothetical protein VD793_10770, partial [Gemmatimonadales bacterium]|nr:hypothetical protein [Gemmatimonadales bacterium]
QSTAVSSPAQVSAPGTAVAHTTELSQTEATVRFETSGGETRSVTLRRGGIYLDGDRIAQYQAGAPFERAWRNLIARGAELSTFQMVMAVRALPPVELAGEARGAWNQAVAALPGLPPGVTIAVPAIPPGPPAADVAVAPGVDPGLGDQIAAEIEAAVAQGIAGPRRRPEARLAAGGVVTDVMGLMGMLVALASLGFGAVFFVPQRLEVVAETVARSPIRAFFAGLFAQPLLLPALVTLVVGLVLTIVGILVVPLAVVAFVLATILATLGGYLAVARVVGELYVRRTGRQDLFTTGWATYRYTVYGLVGLLAIWLPALALQWIPVAGWVLVGAAALFTWIIMTAGLGGVVLSRAGTRGAVANTRASQLSAEFSWTTPRATTGISEARRSS